MNGLIQLAQNDLVLLIVATYIIIAAGWFLGSLGTCTRNWSPEHRRWRNKVILISPLWPLGIFVLRNVPYQAKKEVR